MSAAEWEDSCERAYQASLECSDEIDDATWEKAIDELTGIEMAKVPQWVVWDYEWRGVELHKVAREYVETQTELIEERAREMCE